jgi:1-acyl-sn-glycerol-3-phosphate acyltransferase
MMISWHNIKQFMVTNETPNKVEAVHLSNPLHQMSYRFSAGMLRLLVMIKFGLRVTGKEHLPPEHCGFSYVVAANHTSNWDPPLVGAAMLPRLVSFLAKSQLFEQPVLRWLLTRYCCIYLNREKPEMATIRSAQRVLKSGNWTLGVFPEGTRRKRQEEETPEEYAARLAEETANLKGGAAFFAVKNKAPLLPISIRLQDERPRYHVRIHPLLTLQEGETVDTLTARVQACWREPWV